MRRFLTLAFVPWAALTMLLWAALVSVPILPFVVLPRGKRERYAIQGARLFAWLCLHLSVFARVQVDGRDRLPRSPEGKGYLVVCNHRSWLDPALLILHASAQGIAKKELVWVPFFGPNGYVSGGIFFDRKNPAERAKVVPEAMRLMQSGAKVHLFPEGTRSRDGHLREKVHLKLLIAAWEHGIDVVPACCWGTDEAAPATSIGARPFQRVGVAFGAPLRRDAFANGTAYAEATWDQVKALAAERGVA